MARAAYPKDADLERFLRGAGLITGAGTTAQALLDLVGAIAAAAEDWETATGYKPFLADAADVTRYYDPDGDVIFFRGGYVSVTSVTVDVAPGSDGTVLTVNQDYWLDPRDDLPHKRLYFSEWRRGDPQSIKIIGKRGYQVQIDELVWKAILCRGAELLVPELSAAISKGLVKWKAGDVEKEFGGASSFTRALSGEAIAWAKTFGNAALKYKRI